MIVGTQLMVMGGVTAFYSPSYHRAGEAALFSIEVTHKSGSPSLSVDIEHKNEDDTTWSSAGAFTTITATGVATKDISGLKEELRFKFLPTGTDGEAFHVVLPEPAWRPY